MSEPLRAYLTGLIGPILIGGMIILWMFVGSKLFDINQYFGYMMAGIVTFAALAFACVAFYMVKFG